MNRKESANTFDIHSPPPRRWINPFVGFPKRIVGPKPKGRFRPRPAEQLTHPSLLPDEDLAVMILSDAPHHCPGTGVSTGSQANYLWALMVIRRSYADSDLLKKIDSLLVIMRSVHTAGRTLQSVPAQVHLLVAFACARLERWEDVRIALQMARTSRNIDAPLTHDIEALASQLPAQAA